MAASPALSAPAVAPTAIESASLRRRAGDRLAAASRWTAWIASGALALGFLTHPVSVDAQLALSGGALCGMTLLWLFAPRRGLARMGFIALSSLIVLRYLYWRVSETLPGIDDPVSFGLGLLLLVAELYCVMILAVSLVINADPLTRAEAAPLDEARLPTVDVLIPSYNEDAEILATTVAAARLLDYPAHLLTVWLLDDGGTDQKCADADPVKAAAARARRAELQALCADLGARYLTRARNEHAKAGNLNAGLKASTGEIVVVLDADHAPFRPFLRETIGQFAADPKLFLVQTPHVFLNPDPIERNLRTFDRMPSENEMFYAVTQRGLDKWNGSFFCGSAALLRRAALDDVGGFSGVTITEDCETAFELHSRGWTSAYVDKPLIAGLQPETFAAFIGQRARWCQGMFQIMILKNPLLKPGLKPIQRLGYLSSMAFWFFPLPRLAFMLAPLLHIFFDVKIFVSSLDEALAFTAMYVAANMMLQNYLYGHVRWPWVSELYEYVQGVYLARSIASVIASPRRPSFAVTAKGLTLETNHLSALAWPFFAIFGLLALGCATAAWRYLFEPGVTSLMIVVGLWCLFNLVIAGAALGAVAERRQPERYPSLPVSRTGSATVAGERLDVAIARISMAGCALRRADGAPWAADAAGDGSVTGLALDGAGLAPLSFIVRGIEDGLLAVDFSGLAPADHLALADLMYGDVAAIRDFLAQRRNPKSLLAGSGQFLRWGATEPVRAIGYGIAALRARSDKAMLKAAAPALDAPIAIAVKAEPSAVAIAEAAASPVATVEPPAVVALGAAEPVAAAEPELTLTAAPALAETIVQGPVVQAPVFEAPVLQSPILEAPPAPETAAGPAITPDAWMRAMLTLARGETRAAPPPKAAAPEAAFDADHWMACVLELAETDLGAEPEARPERKPERRLASRSAALSRNAA